MRAPLIMTLICFAAPLASAANVPDFDTKGYCKKTTNIVDSQSDKNYDYCIHSERKAQELLTKLIDAIPVEEVNNCINKASKNDLGSYVELAVCIELHPSFGSSKNTSSTSADRPTSPHMCARRSQYPRRWSLPLIRLPARPAHKFKRVNFASITI